ncbi:MAG: HAMP domain-containing histidine kinase [Clostridia bacterium]|nr:HAMP domain-containing histidine kinase [Clostridia bacterium]
MYKKLKRKIVAAMILSLLTLFIGTLAVIFLTSYHDMLAADRDMMALYAQAYWENGTPSEAFDSPPNVENGQPPQHIAPGGSGSQFYSVEIDKAGKIAAINNEPHRSGLDNEDMAEMARKLAAHARPDGVREAWVYHTETRDGRTLVVMLDNTLVSESASALLKNTLRYGIVMVLVLLLLSLWSAQRMVRPLEENDARQRRFIADASHELKTPVAVIDTNAVLLRKDVGESRWLDNIEAENRRMGTLVGQMLTLSRLEKPVIAHETQDLSRIVEGAVLAFEGVGYEKGHTLEVEIAESIAIVGDGERLKSLMSILLDNAMEYALENAPVHIRLKKERGRAVLRVSNPSSAISNGQTARLFERFYRVDEARNGGTVKQHYGLGLSIARKIVEAHKGSIRAEYVNGCFTVDVSFPAT